MLYLNARGYTEGTQGGDIRMKKAAMAAAAALAMAAPAAAFTLLPPSSHALHTSSSPALRGLCGTPVAGSACSLRPRGKLTLAFQSGTPLDQAKALPPLDLTEENVTKALEEAKDMLGEASLRVSAYLVDFERVDQNRAACLVTCSCLCPRVCKTLITFARSCSLLEDPQVLYSATRRRIVTSVSLET